MWPFRMPPFAGHPGIPSLDLTTSGWLTLFLTTAIAAAAIAQAFVAFRLWKLQLSIESERKRIHIVLEFVKDDDGDPFLKVINASSRGVYIRVFKFSLIFLPEGPKSWDDENGMLLGPYGYEKRNYRNKWQLNLLPLAHRLPSAKQVIRLVIVAFYEKDGRWEQSRDFDFDVFIDNNGRIFEIKPFLYSD